VPTSQGVEAHEPALITALVEQNHVHMDDADTAVVLAALEELGVQAEATEQTTVLKAAWWVLTLHWIGDDLPHLGFDSLLTLLGQRVWRHYRDLGKMGPSRIDIYNSEDEIITSHDIEDEAPDDSGGQT
jgi:hypothetical protein